MYEVIVDFTDLQDNNYRYHAGDKFPRKGFKVSEERIEELATNKNRRRIPMIVKVEEPIKKEEAPKKPVEKPVEKPKKGGKKKDA